MAVDPTTILVGTGIALSSAIGGWLAAVKINRKNNHFNPCPLLDVAMKRLNRGDEHFKEIDKKLEILPRLDEKVKNIKETVGEIKKAIWEHQK